jgi:dTDP-glucose pyrophosphorylase
MKENNKHKVLISDSIRNAVRKMDEGGISFCVCVDEKDKVMGVITDGDFRRAVHNEIQLDENVTKIINKNFLFVEKGYEKLEVESIFRLNAVQQIPVLDAGKLIDIISLDKFMGEDKCGENRILDNPVVIMAGGKGARLDPFTRILPKPLIPIGQDPVVKVIMDEFHKFGIDHFYISLKEKEKMVVAYFQDHTLGYGIEYVRESEPLGTAGALRSLENKIKRSFFVSNCDIIVHADYGAFYDFHKSGNYALTIVGSMRQYTIPYGVCEIENGSVLKSIREKPQYDFLVNTGLYLLEPEVLQLIPKGKSFHMTDLILKVQEKGLKVGVFPVSERSWIDVGQLSEYKEVISKLIFEG